MKKKNLSNKPVNENNEEKLFMLENIFLDLASFDKVK